MLGLKPLKLPSTTKQAPDPTVSAKLTTINYQDVTNTINDKQDSL